jgi:hypothetical protein
VQGSPRLHHASLAMDIDLLLPYLLFGLFGLIFSLLLLALWRVWR